MISFILISFLGVGSVTNDKQAWPESVNREHTWVFLCSVFSIRFSRRHRQSEEETKTDLESSCIPRFMTLHSPQKRRHIVYNNSASCMFRMNSEEFFRSVIKTFLVFFAISRLKPEEATLNHQRLKTCDKWMKFAQFRVTPIALKLFHLYLLKLAKASSLAQADEWNFFPRESPHSKASFRENPEII